MRKYLILFLLQGIAMSLFAQSDFNKWSIHLAGGFNKPMGPLTGGYYSPTLNFGHGEIGARYMFTNKFGVAGNLGGGSFKESRNTPSFSANYMNASVFGVMNLGRILNFESFTSKFTMLSYLGTGVGYLKHEHRPINDYDPDYVYSFTGATSLVYKITERISLQGKISSTFNGRQRYTFDGNDFNQPGRPEGPETPFIHQTGTWWTGTIGLNFYLGKAEQHADWYVPADKYATKEELSTQINGIKDMLKDSDGDGIPDYLDKEPNTPAGARVNSAGVTLDSDGDGTPDHLDKCPFLPGPANTNGCPVEVVKEEIDFLKKAINDGYVNVYYAYDSSKPLGYSVSAAQYVSNFMKRNPNVKIDVKGYADELGPEDYNMKLSEKRAKAVYDLIVASGIDASRLSYKGYGEDTSVDKSSADARQMARRVSFEVK